MDPNDVRLVFMGSPAFAVPSLRALHAAGYRVVSTVTQPDRPAGRRRSMARPEVKIAAEELGIPVFQPDSLRPAESFEHLRSLSPDVIVVAAYGKILAQRVLDLPRVGAVNVHASLLPRWRGASPVNAAILAGDRETGVTVMEMVAALDAGPIVSQRAITIEAADTAGTLEERLAGVGATLLVETLPSWIDGTLTARPQDDSQATFCKLIDKEDGHLRASMTAAEAERAVRAYDPWPGAYVGYRGQRLGIWRAHVVDASDSCEPGTLSRHGRHPAIHFAGGLLVLEEVQRAGARRVSGEAFVNGERGDLRPMVELA